MANKDSVVEGIDEEDTPIIEEDDRAQKEAEAQAQKEAEAEAQKEAEAQAQKEAEAQKEKEAQAKKSKKKSEDKAPLLKENMAISIKVRSTQRNQGSYLANVKRIITLTMSDRATVVIEDPRYAKQVLTFLEKANSLGNGVQIRKDVKEKAIAEFKRANSIR